MSSQNKSLAINFISPPVDPLLLLKQWLQTAEKLKVQEPYNLVLSTVNTEHQPSSRVVLIIDHFDEATLRARVLEQLNQSGEIPCPAGWHAYHIAIETIEFWQGTADRFSQRLKYSYIKNVWQHQRLQP